MTRLPEWAFRLVLSLGILTAMVGLFELGWLVFRGELAPWR